MAEHSRSKKILKHIKYELEELKAENIVDIDVTKLTDVTDYIVIVSGTSSRHVKSLAKNLANKLKADNIKPNGIEDDPSGQWILIDYIDVVVHIMLPATRELYDLEKFWTIEIAEKLRR
ncbi:MAG: ribosome silencing factor [Gammaproteobacteria bacterium]|nr:ribosome silencing factor [Gammaproteobacteria bacterium]